MTDKNSARFDDPDDEFADRFEDEVEDDYADLDDDFEDDEFDDDDDESEDDEFDDDEFDDDEFDDDDDELDDDDDELDDDDDLSTLTENLAAFFAGDDFEIVELAALLRESLEESAAPETYSTYPPVSLAEALHRLRAGLEPPALADVAALARALPSERDQLRTVWPTLPIITRRTVLDLLVAVAEEGEPVDLSELLRLALDDDDVRVRQAGIAGLFDDAPPEFLGRLAQLVRHDADAGVRAAAAAALGNYVLAGELDELEPALAMRAEEALMATLADAGAPLAVHCRALESIAYSGEVGVRQLIEDAYYSAHEDLRLSALRAMGRSADTRWRNLVRAELTNPSPAMRAEAAFAVGELEAVAALPEVLALTDDEDDTVRLAAIYALGHLGGREARARLQEIGNGASEVEAAAAEDALEEMAFYAGGDAQTLPLYDDSEDDGEADDDDDWRFAADSELGEYD